MDLEQLQALGNAEKARYMALGKLFEHPSYKYLMEWAKSSVNEATGRELNAVTWEHVLLNRGARLAFTDLVNLETQVENEFVAIADAAMASWSEEPEQTGLEDV